MKVDSVDLDWEIGKACEFLWADRDEMSLREFAGRVREHLLDEKGIKVTSEEVLTYLVEIEG